jgi:peptidoglycan hydrolase-like protein with peptidoglycan-binding domain
MELENYNGVVLDPRPEFKKALDYQHSDLAGASVPEWKEKPTIEWKQYTPRNQSGSLSCVGQSCAKAFEVLGLGVESAHPIYRNRSNFPDGGMWLGNAGDICKNIGTTKEVLDVSQFLGESKMNLPCDVEKPDKALGYVFVNGKDIDQIAQAIDLYGHCILIFHANGGEWIDVPKYNGKPVNFGHAVCAVDYFIFNGSKAILIEDSASLYNTFDGRQQRVIKEEYLQARCSGAMYLTPKPIVPVFTFTKTLKLGLTGYDVKMLQIKLGIGADGIFGLKTKGAVIKFQLKHNLRPDGIVGVLTNKALNS